MKSLFSSLLPLASILIALLTPSCSPHSSTSDGGLTVIPIVHVDVDAPMSVPKTSEVLKDARIITLETSDDCLLNRITSIKTINGSLYIRERRTTLYQFDGQGHFLSSLSKCGAGPEEYVNIDDFDVDRDGNVYVLSQNERCVYVYDKNGAFRDKLTIDGYATSLCVMADGKIFVCFANDKNPNRDKKIVAVNGASGEGFLAVDTLINGFPFPSSRFVRDGDSFVFSEVCNDTVYGVSSEGVKPIAIMDYAGRSVSVDFLRSEHDFIHALSQSGLVYAYDEFLDADTFAYVSFNHVTEINDGINMFYGNALVNKLTGESKRCFRFSDDLCLFGFKVSVSYPVDRHSFATSVEMASLLEYAESLSPSSRDSLLARINYQGEDQNPVILIGTLK